MMLEGKPIRLYPGEPNNYNPIYEDDYVELGVRAMEVNLFDAAAVSRAVTGHDVVVNLATHIPDPSRMFLPWAWRENDRLRRVASAILVDASLASTVGRFVQESFAPVYPDSGSEWIEMSLPLFGTPTRTMRPFALTSRYPISMI